jgi:hypothetical protein
MTMKITVPVCIICESEDVELWTVDGRGKAAVTYVCGEHSAPLEAILEASEGLPLNLQTPLSQQTAMKKARNIDLVHRRRVRTMEPLLDWTPPADEPAPAREILSEEDRAALQAQREADAAAKAEREAQAAAIRAEREAASEAEAAAKAARYEAEELVVRDGRAEGKTWDEIAALLGTTRQNVWSKYKQRYKAKGPKPGSPEQVVGAGAVLAGVDHAVQFSENATEEGSGSDSHDVGVGGPGDVHDLGLQALEPGDTLDGLEHEGRGTGQLPDGGVVIDQVEVA